VDDDRPTRDKQIEGCRDVTQRLFVFVKWINQYDVVTKPPLFYVIETRGYVEVGGS
jgi:hypothetical protein